MKESTHIVSWRVLIHVILVRPFLRLFFGVNVAGAENLADLDQFILIANHNSHLDVLVLFCILPVKHIATTHPVAAEEYFSRWEILFRAVDYLLQPIWVVRGAKVKDPLEGMKERLDAGRSIIIFPEGTRGTPGQIEKFKTGVGRLAAEYGHIPVVPVFLSGPERAFPKKSSVPLPLWNDITVGPPQVLAGDCRDITVALENALRELSESAAANRHRRRKRPEPAFTVAILGIDGSGKSTLSREVAKQLSDTFRVCLVTDTLELYEHATRRDVQPLLTERVREAVGAYAKTAKSLKHYKAPKMAELFLRDRIMGEAERWYSPGLVVLDGCPLMNLAAWSRLYLGDRLDVEACAAALRVLSCSGDEVPRNDPVFAKVPELATLKRLHLPSMKLPDAVIMLDVDPAVSVSRIESRGEKRQVHETEEKLANLREGYLLVCDAVKTSFGIPTLILDGHSSMKSLAALALEFIEENRGEESADG